VEQPLGAALMLGRRQVQKCQIVAALMMRAVGREGRIPFLVDEPRGSIGKAMARVLIGRYALGLEEQGPAFTKPAQHVVEPRRDGDELRIRRTVEIRTTIADRALEGSILVQH